MADKRVFADTSILIDFFREDQEIVTRRLEDPDDPVLTEEEFLKELGEDFGWNV